MSKATQFMTAVFKCDLRKVDGNPHHKDTPFGRAVALAVGDAITEQQAEIDRLRGALQECADAFEDHAFAYPAMVKGYTIDAQQNARKALETKP